MALSDYTVVYSGGLGSGPSAQTFAQLGVTAATIVSLAGGGDYAEITVDVSITEQGMPLRPLARHSIYDDTGTLRFVGWLMQPGRGATPENHQQTFRLEGPNSRLAQRTFQQPWNYAEDPTSYTSDLTAVDVPHVLLNLQNYETGTRVNVAAQIREVLDYYISQYSEGAPISYDPISLAGVPAVQPPEDEQTDTTCDIIIQRELRWVPKVTAYWTYPNVNPPVPVLCFSANDAVAASDIDGDVGIVPGVGLITLHGYQSILIDPTSGTLTSFQSKSRYDLLVAKVFVYYQAEQEVTDDGSITGNRKLWATLASEVSEVDNGSDKQVTYCIDLRGAGGARDATTGLPETPQEPVPTGLAAALHDPFKVLTHSLQWSIVGADVDWNTLVGAAVGVRNGGSDLLAGSRSIIQQISRDLATGTTTYQAGPPSHLGINDISSLTRFNKSRNAARNGGGSSGGGYNKGGGPNQKVTAKKALVDAGGGGGGAQLWWNVMANGQAAYAQFASTTPVATLPSGATPVNPA